MIFQRKRLVREREEGLEKVCVSDTVCVCVCMSVKMRSFFVLIHLSHTL